MTRLPRREPPCSCGVVLRGKSDVINNLSTIDLLTIDLLGAQGGGHVRAKPLRHLYFEKKLNYPPFEN